MSLGSRIIAWGVAIGLGFATALGWLAKPHAPNLEVLIVLILWFNLAIILVALGVEIGRRPYSLHLMHLICLFLFLGAASLLQYSAGRFGVAGPIGTVRDQTFVAAAATTLWLAGYLAAYEGLRLVHSGGGRGFVSRYLERPIAPARALLLACLGIIGIVYLAAMGLLGAGTRAAAEEAILRFSVGAGVGDYTHVFGIINNNLARALPPVALLAALLVLLRDRRGRNLMLIPPVIGVGFGTLAVNNPFAAPRIFLTTTLIGFTAPFFLRRFKTGWLLVVLILAGLALLPALSASREVLDLEEYRRSGYLRLASPLGYLAANSDVDSLGMTALCQMWVDRFGHRWGLQILGALLFWVPRAIWSTKPIGTGSMVTGDLGFDFTNLAPPISAEALVDFGLVGVPVLGAIFAWILASLDACYWSRGREALGSTHRIIDAIYPFWLACVVQFSRGDLFAAMTHTAGFTVWIVPLGAGLMLFRGDSTRSAIPLPQASVSRSL